MNYQKVYMNQIYSSSIMRQVAQMWKNQLLCDAVIKTGNIQTKAHRLVLIAACPMLQHMENASVGSHLEVRLNADIKQNSVNTFLQYLYEGYMMLTEENCKDVEKIAKLLHADSVAKCCVDFQKCLNTKSGMPSYEGANFEVQDSVEFRYVCSTNIQKTLQDGAMKRSSENSGRPPSPSSKRARVAVPQSPTAMGRADDRFSMAHSYTQDPFERIPRLGSGFPQPKPPPGVIEIVEDSVELVTSEPPERDPDGWPRKSDKPPIQKSMSISVAGQVKGGESDLQIIDVSSLSSPSQSKPPNTTRVRSDSASDRLSGSFEASQSMRSSQKQSPYSTEQSQSPRSEFDGSFQRQQFSQSAAPKQTQPRSSHPSQPPQLKHMSIPGVQNSQKSFAAGSPSQASFAAGSSSQASFTTGSSGSHSSSPQLPPSSASNASSSSPRNVPETSQSSPTKSSSETGRRPQTAVLDQPPPDSAQQGQENAAPKPPEKDPGTQRTTEIHAEDLERLLAASEPVVSQRGDSGEKSTELNADLTVIKIEEEEEDTGGLDMYVDVPDDSKQPVNLGGREGSAELSEIEDPPGEWSREDFSNESGSFGADPNISWQDASFSKEPSDNSNSKESCKKCGALIEKPQLDIHMKVVHGFMEQCNLCLVYFETRDQLTDHIVACHSYAEQPSSIGTDLFVDNSCKVCGELVDPVNKLEHLRLYHGFIAVCEICPKYFKSREGYGYHMMMYHSDQSSSHPCSKCGKRFQTPSLLKRHMKIHSSSRPFVCQVCSRSFKFNWVLQNHLKRHEQGS